jgi:hypothetical protein
VSGFKPHYTNGLIKDGPHEHTQNGQTDTAVQPTVYEYMYDNGWQDAHVLWHQARGCSGAGGGAGINGLPSACNFREFLPKQNDCQGAINGVDFFSGHRLMMEQLKQLWPDHQEQFTGWGKFPRTAADYPAALRTGNIIKAWPQAILDAAEIGDNIEKYLSKFPTEGDLGTWISCAIMPGTGGQADFSTARNLHFALHNNGIASKNQKHLVNNNNVNIDSYLFWKLHGWIDNVWERYRIAKGKTRNDADYKAEMLEQCREMDKWRQVGMDTRGANGHPNEDDTFVPIVVETGIFHETVRPAFEGSVANCSSCHGAGEAAGLRLGYQITSTEIVAKLVNRAARGVSGWKMVVPGKPEESWLYMKASGQSANANVTCLTDGCKSPMTGLTPAEVQALYDWIKNGAEAPVQWD